LAECVEFVESPFGHHRSAKPALCNTLRRLKRTIAQHLFKLLERYDQPGIEVLELLDET
jgi:hypothetical protein